MQLPETRERGTVASQAVVTACSQGMQPLSFTSARDKAPIQQPALTSLLPPQTLPRREKHALSAFALPTVRWSLLPDPGFCPLHSTLHRLHIPPHLCRRSAHYHAIAPPAEDTHTTTLHSLFMSLSVSLQIAGTDASNVRGKILPSCLCCTKDPGGIIMPSLASADPPRSSSSGLLSCSALFISGPGVQLTRMHERQAHKHMNEPLEVHGLPRDIPTDWVSIHSAVPCPYATPLHSSPSM